VQQTGQFPSVDRNVPSGVIAQVEGRDTAVAGKQAAVGGIGITRELPDRLVGHQSVHEQGNMARRLRKCLGKAVAMERQHFGSRAQGHGDRQCGSLIGKPIAEEPVDDGDRVVAPTWHSHEQAKKSLGVGQDQAAVAIDLNLRYGPIIDHELTYVSSTNGRSVTRPQQNVVA
jgi:hypothetical protein